MLGMRTSRAIPLVISEGGGCSVKVVDDMCEYNARKADVWSIFGDACERRMRTTRVGWAVESLVVLRKPRS